MSHLRNISVHAKALLFPSTTFFEVPLRLLIFNLASFHDNCVFSCIVRVAFAVMAILFKDDALSVQSSSDLTPSAFKANFKKSGAQSILQ